MPTDINEYFKNRREGNQNNDNKNSSNNNNNKKNNNRGNGGNQPPFEPPEFMNNFGKKAVLIYAIIFIALILFVSKPFVVINSGEVGIKITTGKFEDMPLNPGFHMYMPFIQKVIVVDTKVRIINYKSVEDMGVGGIGTGIKTNPAISVLDQRGLPVSIELTVQYKLKPQGAPKTIATWGLSWEDKIINPVVRDVVRNVVGGMTAEELPAKRNTIAKLIEQGIQSKVNALEDKPVTVESIQLREIVLPPKIKEQIERVQIANQEAQKVRYEVERTKQEAQKAIAKANGEAESKKINAQGLADAIEIEAKAQAKANALISKSLTRELLELKHIETQSKFNEALKVNKDAKIFLTPGGAVPNIWVDTKDSQKATVTNQQ
jgi:regulator of protease activity HflC (stomatin/prohibitin superfamily)